MTGKSDRKKSDASQSALQGLTLLIPSLKGTILVVGIYVFFLASGIFQESVYKVGDKALGDTFRYPILLVALLCVGNVLMSGFILFIETKTPLHPDVDPPEIDDAGVAHVLTSPTIAGKRRIKNKVSFIERYIINLDRSALYDIALSSVTYVLSMLCTNYALTHVNFPTQVLVKSAKSVPVILGGFVFFGKRYPLHDYIAVIAVTASLAVFNLSRDKSNSSSHQTALGLALLGVSLFCDSLTGPRQDHLLARVRISSTHLMFLTNIFGSVLAVGASLVFEGLQPISFCFRFPEVISHVMLFCLSASLGQFFIFASLTAFGSLYLTLITTTRKFFSVLLSVLLFGHTVSFIQWTCVATIFTSLAAQNYFTKKLKLSTAMAKKGNWREAGRIGTFFLDV